MTTIIHINAHTETQQQVREALEKAFTLVSVADAPTAIQYCAMIHPDLIVIDARMPEFTPLTARLRMFMPETPMLVLAHPTAPRPETPDSRDAVYEWTGAPAELRRQIDLLLAPDNAGPPPASELEHQIMALSQANQRLASLNAVSALIGTSLDLEHLTDEILQQIQKTVDFDSATLFLLKGSVLEAAASRGLHTYRRGLNIFTRSDNNSAWQVVRNKLPLVINDVTQSPLWQPTPELGRVRAWLGVPLIYKERVVGVLTLDKNERDSFTEADARHIFTLAFQIAIAVENAQLFEEWESQAARLKLINEVNQQLTTILDAGSLYHTLAQALVDRLAYDRVTIFELNSAQTALQLQACCYGPAVAHYVLPDDGFAVSVNSGLLGNVARTGRSTLVKDLVDAAPELPGMVVRSALITPVFVDNRLAAVVNVESRRPNAFNDHDLWTISSLTTHAAAILQNARLYHDVDAYSEKLQRTVTARTQRLHAIKSISQAISQGVGVDELWQVVGQRIRQIFADATDRPLQVAMALLNGSRLTVRESFSEAAPARVPALPGVTCKLDFRSVAGQVIELAQSVIRHGVDSRQIFSGQPLRQPRADSSLMAVPLITAGKTIGVILVSTPKTVAFDEADLETLETVAFQVASAIESARLLRKTREMAIVDERTRLARDMHDGIAQNLAYLLIQVDRCLGLAPAGSKLEQQLESIGGLLEQNIEELRRNIFDLRPVELEGQPLVAVLDKFVTDFGRRWNLKTECRIESRVENVLPAVESTLYRLLQEALSNARRHANCTGVWVTLAVRQPWLILTIADDGQGFDHTLLEPAQKEGRRGLGLISMRERVEHEGGQFEISSAAGRGTRIEARLPLEPVADKLNEQEPER